MNSNEISVIVRAAPHVELAAALSASRTAIGGTWGDGRLLVWVETQAQAVLAAGFGAKSIQPGAEMPPGHFIVVPGSGALNSDAPSNHMAVLRNRRTLVSLGRILDTSGTDPRDSRWSQGLKTLNLAGQIAPHFAFTADEGWRLPSDLEADNWHPVWGTSIGAPNWCARVTTQVNQAEFWRSQLSIPARPDSERPRPDVATSQAALNIVVASLAMGGAERIALESALLISSAGYRVNLYTLYKADNEFPFRSLGLPESLSVRRFSFCDDGDGLEKMAAAIVASGNPVAITHLVRTRALRRLWRFGIRTVPVLHNDALGWQDRLTEYDATHVPMLIACSRQIAEQARAKSMHHVVWHRHLACPSRWFQPDSTSVRLSLGIDPDVRVVLLIGALQPQKAYRRVPEILKSMRAAGGDYQVIVVGGRGRADGTGHDEYVSLIRNAVAHSVERYIHFLGSSNVHGCLREADVFLNVSSYEGFSIACQEAILAGMPVVCSDVGGQSELGEMFPRADVTLFRTIQRPTSGPTLYQPRVRGEEYNQPR